MANITSSGVLADSQARGGLHTGIPDQKQSPTRSSFNTWLEEFKYTVINSTVFATLGWTNSGRNTPTSPTIVVTNATGYAEIFAGTKDESGTNLQRNAVPTAAAAAPPHEIAGPIISTTTLMDGRELVWGARVGVKQAASATWTSAALVGWCVTDTAIMNQSTAVIGLTTGGGFGFRIGLDGSIEYFYQAAGAETDANATATGQFIGENGTDNELTAAGEFEWINLGCRARWVDADAGTGSIDYYVNDVKVATVVDEMCMQATQAYSFTAEVLNGTGVDASLGLDYVVTAISTESGRS